MIGGMHPMSSQIVLVVLSLVLAPSPGFDPDPDVTRPAARSSTGADVTVYALSGTANYGSEYSDEFGQYVSGFAIGTIACNSGDENLVWFADTSEHPVIAQNLYRLMDARFEQVGMSWVKHGFFATDSDYCGPCSDQDGTIPGSYLAVGCSDLYSASLNGNWAYLGPRSEVNAHTGFHLGRLSYGVPPVPHIAERRLQAANVDLDPDANPGAAYFVEGHYVTPDDAADGNGNNNVTYRPAYVLRAGIEEYALEMDDDLSVSQTPAIYAWAASDPDALITEAPVPGEGLFVVGAKATDIGGGFYAYEFAVYNMNSDRSGGSFSVPIPVGSIVRGAGFHDADYHSGEPYDDADWSAVIEPDAVTWTTVPYDQDVHANALRWATLYNFRFECSASPGPTSLTLGLFKPGTIPEVSIASTGPIDVIPCQGDDQCDDGEFCTGSGRCVAGACVFDYQSDCNDNMREDSCDLAEGTSADCNANTIPDECDIATGLSLDDNGNGIPDECCEPVAPAIADSSGLRKNRYISLEPPDLGEPYAIRVRLQSLSGFSGFNQELRWVGPASAAPDEYSDDPTASFMAARLTCDPLFADWSTIDVLHVYGGDIIPGSTYHVQLIGAQCAEQVSLEASYSPHLEVITTPWGDAVEPFFDNPNGVAQPDFNDISGIVSKFLADPDAPLKVVAQLQPDCVKPWNAIDFRDIAASVGGFRGESYPFTGPCPCPSTFSCQQYDCLTDGECASGLCMQGYCADACGRCRP